jgi:hypothetical protein
MFNRISLLSLSALIAMLVSGCEGDGSSVPASTSFSSQPSSTTPLGTTNGVISPFQVSLLNASGNLDSTSSAPVTVVIASQPNSDYYAGILGGATTVNAVGGVATFSGLTVTQPGSGFKLMASSPGYVSSESTPFNVSASLAGFSATGAVEGCEVLYVGGIGSNFQGPITAYLAQPNNAINCSSGSDFANYAATHPGYIPNTPRDALFNYAKTLGSPSATPGALTPFTDSTGYTWGIIASVQNYHWPFSAANYAGQSTIPTSGWQAALTNAIPPGVVTYTFNNKNQQLLLTKVDSNGNNILYYFVTDQFGNVYFMKSANKANNTPELLAQSFNAAVLPAGWTKSSGYLTQDLFVNPAYGGDSNTFASFQEFRDNADNAYTQIAWAKNGDSIAALIGSPMPVWSGPMGGRINGSAGNDLLYGALADDQFYPLAGNDSIDGGGGSNKVVFSGARDQYTISSANGVTTVTGADGVKTMKRIQYLQFRDQTVSLN